MDTGQQSLGGGDGALEALDDPGEGVADCSFFLELGLQGVKDFGVEQRHGGVLERDVGGMCEVR